MLAGASLFVGLLASRAYGVVVFAAGLAAGITFEFAGRETDRRSALREAADAPHLHGASGGTRHILVVASVTLGGEELRRELEAGGAGVELDVLAPILASRSHYWASDVDREREEAHERLEASLAWAAEQGFAAKGEVGDPDPLVAIEDELRDFGADEVIIVTHPGERVSWLANRMLSHLARELDVPVRQIAVADGEDRTARSLRSPRRRSDHGPPSLAAGARAAALVGVGGLIGVAASGGRQPQKTATPTPTASPTAIAAVDPHVAAGAHDFVQFACGQCHGDLGPRRRLAGCARAHLRREGADAVGAALDHRPRAWRVEQPDQALHARLGRRDLQDAGLRPDCVPACRAAGGADGEAAVDPRGQGAAVEGAALYDAYGCVNCHGPNGLGGVPNPQSPDKTIPPLSGQDFRKEFNTDAKIIAVIRSGSVIGRAPIVSMPHWGGIIPDERLRALVAYLKTLQ